jgi:hypothetical protein
MSEMSKNSHKAGHPDHKNEMEHHRMRDKAHSAHRSHMEHGNEKPPHEVKDSHQEGISRVKQKPGSMPVGQHGSMAGGWKHEGLKK